MREMLQYALFLLVPFAVQLVILFLTENRFQPLRLAIPGLAAIAGVVFFLAGILPPGMGRAFWWLALFLILLGLGLVLVGWMLAWLVYYLTTYLTKRKAGDAENLS